MQGRLLGTWTLGVLAACGDPLVGDDFRGEPEWSSKIMVLAGSPEMTELTNLRMAMFFSPSGLRNADPELMVEHVASGRPIVIPSESTLNVFEPPNEAHRITDPALPAGTYLARVMVYEDTDLNGRRDPGEPVRGAMSPYAYVYSETGTPAGTVTAQALPAGFSRLAIPQTCGAPPPGPVTPGNCGVPLGERCSSNAECGTGGFCLQQTKLPWPAGYCSILETPTTPCRPGDGYFQRRQQYSPGPAGAKGYWLRKCTTDQDCRRDGDPANGHTQCDPGYGACISGSIAPLNAGGRVEIEPFCEADVTR